MRNKLLLFSSILLLSFSATKPGRYYSRFQMPYLEELKLHNNHSFVYKYSHFENAHDEHKKRGTWTVKNDSLILQFNDGGSARFGIAEKELRSKGGEAFKKK